MSIATITCIVFACIFLLLAILFALLKEKGAILISGFNSLPKEERIKYNRLRMSEDIRNSLFIWFFIFAIGAVLTEFLSEYFVALAFIVWGVLFFKEVHLDTNKAFEKYRYKNIDSKKYNKIWTEK